MDEMNEDLLLQDVLELGWVFWMGSGRSILCIVPYVSESY